jgi:hypothetical protein
MDLEKSPGASNEKGHCLSESYARQGRPGAVFSPTPVPSPHSRLVDTKTTTHTGVDRDLLAEQDRLGQLDLAILTD